MNAGSSSSSSFSSQRKAGNKSSSSSRTCFRRQSLTTAAGKAATSVAKKEGALAPPPPRSSRRSSSSSSSSSSLLGKLFLLLLLSILLGTTGQAKPMHHQHRQLHQRSAAASPFSSSLESAQNKANLNKQQLISRYNFYCIGPSDVKPHRGFTSEPPPTTNASLTELRNDLYYIRSMAQELKSIHGMGTTVGDNSISEIDATQTLPNLPNPIPLDDKDDINYTKAFNRSNHLLMEYLNGIAQAELSMMESARLDGRLFNITDIEYELAAWLHKLHLKMIQNSVDIDCEGIKALLQRPPPKPVSKLQRKHFVPLLIRKLTHIMGNVIAMFDRAIKNQSVNDQRVDRAKKDGERLHAAEPSYGKSKRRGSGQVTRKVHSLLSSLPPRQYGRESREVMDELSEGVADAAVEGNEVPTATEGARDDQQQQLYTWPNFNRKRSYTKNGRGFTQPKYSSLWEENDEY